MSVGHRALRPSWNCRVCNKPWPCEPARELLVRELPGTYLVLFMAIDLSEAARDNPSIAPAELYRRFISWTRDVPQTLVDGASRIPLRKGCAGEEHQPARPSWDCLACEKPWPCDPARECLTATMDRITLAMYAWDLLEQAAEELLSVEPAELFDRFLKWTRYPRAPRAEPTGRP